MVEGSQLRAASGRGWRSTVTDLGNVGEAQADDGFDAVGTFGVEREPAIRFGLDAEDFAGGGEDERAGAGDLVEVEEQATAAGLQGHDVDRRQGGVEEVEEAAFQDGVRAADRLVEAGGDDVGPAAEREVVRLGVGQADRPAGALDEREENSAPSVR